MAMYLSRELTGQSLPSIGRQFGGRDHTTVLHACRRTSARISSDDCSREAVEKLLQRPRLRARALEPRDRGRLRDFPTVSAHSVVHTSHRASSEPARGIHISQPLLLLTIFPSHR